MTRPTKSPPLYLLWRAVWIIAFIGTQVLGLWQFLLMANAGPKDTAGVFLYVPIMMIVLVPVVFTFFSACVFKFNFSVFGKFIRTPWPEEQPITVHRGSWGRISWCRGTIPFFSWVLFPSGLGFSVMGVGKGFIPLASMSALDKGVLACVLRHDSEEVRSPVHFPHEDIYTYLREKIEG